MSTGIVVQILHIMVRWFTLNLNADSPPRSGEFFFATVEGNHVATTLTPVCTTVFANDPLLPTFITYHLIVELMPFGLGFYKATCRRPPPVLFLSALTGDFKYPIG